MPKRTKRSPEEDRIGRREAVRRYREKNRELMLERTRQWRKKNPEKLKEACQKRKIEKRDELIAYEKQRYAKDPEKGKARARRWVENNPEKYKAALARRVRTEYDREMARKWRKENPEKVKKATKQWAQANVEKVREYGHRRRAIQRGSGGRITPKQIQELWEKQNGLCVYYANCGNALSREGKWPVQLDHIDPLMPKDASRKPGAHSIENAQLLCGLCNRKKRNHDPYKFTQAHEGRLFPDLPRDPKKR